MSERGRVFKEMGWHAFNVFFTFVVTFLAFPSIMISAKFNWEDDKKWSPIVQLFLFNLFDTIGRYLPALKKIFSPKTVWIPNFARF
jgi:hypothetical protein